jgi:hypothetical protein
MDLDRETCLLFTCGHPPCKKMIGYLAPTISHFCHFTKSVILTSLPNKLSRSWAIAEANSQASTSTGATQTRTQTSSTPRHRSRQRCVNTLLLAPLQLVLEVRSGWHKSGSDRQSHAIVDYTVNGDVETSYVYP